MKSGEGITGTIGGGIAVVGGTTFMVETVDICGCIRFFPERYFTRKIPNVALSQPAQQGTTMISATTLILAGRILLGLFFVIAGIRNFMRFPERLKMETNYGWKLPAAAKALGFAAQLVAGLSVALGIYPVWGAVVLIIFLILATALYHNFLLFKGEARAPHLYFTLVNCALVGYCLMVIGTAP